MRRILALGCVVSLALTVLWFATADGQEKNGADLEKLQAEALKNNHDVKVAEAKLRLAQALLERAQARVKSGVAAAVADIKAAHASEQEAKVSLDRAERLWKSGAISREEMAGAHSRWSEVRRQRELAERRLRDLVGN